MTSKASPASIGIFFDRSRHVETVIILSQQKPSDRIEVGLDLDELDVTSAETKTTFNVI